MKNTLLGAVLFLCVLISPPFTQAAGLTTDQSIVLINVVKASPGTPASAFIELITAFSGVTVNQATALITVVQSSPATPASVFVPLLTSFTSGALATQTAVQSTAQTTNQTQSSVTKSPTCTLDVTYGPGGGAKKYGLTGTGYYDGSGSAYVEIHAGEPVTVSWTSTNADYSQEPGGDKDLSNGSATYYPGGDKAYVWNFYGKGGSTSCGVMVEILQSKSVTSTTAAPSATIDQNSLNTTPSGPTTITGTATDASGVLVYMPSNSYTGGLDYASVSSAAQGDSTTQTAIIAYPYPSVIANGRWSAYFGGSFSSGASSQRVLVYDASSHTLLTQGTLTIANPTPTVTVISPNGGETFRIGDKVTVAWSSTGEVSKTYISWLQDRNGDGTYETVYGLFGSAAQSASGSALWTIPSQIFNSSSPSTRNKISVNTSTAGITDQSNAPFSIIAN